MLPLAPSEKPSLQPPLPTFSRWHLFHSSSLPLHSRSQAGPIRRWLKGPFPRRLGGLFLTLASTLMIYNLLNAHRRLALLSLWRKTPPGPASVLLYDQSEGSLSGSPPPNAPYRFTKNKLEADVVVWPIPYASLSSFNKTEARLNRPWQVNAFWSLENGQYYPDLQEARQRLLAKDDLAFDLEMTYRTSSDIPVPYAYDFMDFHKKPLPFEERRQDKIAAAFISNCSPQNNRTEVFQELLRLLPGQVDSFGACLKNADPSQFLRQFNITKPDEELSRWNEKMRVIERYKFTIAFENADEEDYVTEKYYQALSGGSIPIHLGQSPEQFEKFKPASNGAFNVRDFPTLDALVERIKDIANDKRKFEDALAWKDQPLTGRFAEIVGWGKMNEWVRIANFLHKQFLNPRAANRERYPELISRWATKPGNTSALKRR